MGAAREVDAGQFRDALALMVADVRGITVALDEVAPRHARMPWEHSPAMRERADESDYVQRSDWTGPITDTQGLGGLTLQAASDYVRTFAEAFSTQSVPTYGHLVVARAALESSVVSSWLSEAGIARDERVKRGLSEFLYSASEVFRLKLPGGSPENVREWTARATALGWAATDYDEKPWKPRSRGTPRVDGVERPLIAAGITGLLINDADSKIGKWLWSRLSAVAHVTFFGLQAAILLGDSKPSVVPGLASVPVGTDAAAVALQAFCIVRALRKAATAHFALMGWEDDQWKAARDQAEQTELKLFRTGRAAAPDLQAEPESTSDLNSDWGRALLGPRQLLSVYQMLLSHRGISSRKRSVSGR